MKFLQKIFTEYLQLVNAKNSHDTDINKLVCSWEALNFMRAIKKCNKAFAKVMCNEFQKQKDEAFRLLKGRWDWWQTGWRKIRLGSWGMISWQNKAGTRQQLLVWQNALRIRAYNMFVEKRWDWRCWRSKSKKWTNKI